MNKMMYSMMLLASTAVLMAACTKDSTSTSSSYSPNDNNDNSNGSTGGGTSSASLGTGELSTFTVEIDLATAEPSSSATATYPEAEDNLDDSSNSEFTDGTASEVAIDMSNPTVGEVNGVTITNDHGNIKCDHGSNKVCYVVSGTTSSGSLTILGEKKCEVKLNGVNITSPDSAALNILSKKRAFVYLADGTNNTLTDTKCDDSNTHKGALYAKGKLLLHGTGTLNVYGNHNNAIHSADYIIFNKGVNVYANSTANHGVKANDGIYVNGGILNVEVSAAAAKGINCESDIIVNGGRTTVITTGNGAYDSDEQDAKGSAGIKSDTNFTINDGVVKLRSTGTGGKGISTDGTCTFNGGSVYVITTGGQYQYSSSLTAKPKGIKADGNLTVNGGSVMVRTSGSKGEAIESKSALTVNGGSVSCYSQQDDALNAAGTFTINDGYVLGYSAGNDGLDANGDFYIKGGVVYAIGASSPEVAIDANSEQGKKLYLQGGTLIAVGGLESGSQLSQACYQASSWSRGTWYALTAGSTTIAFQTPSTGGNGLVVSTASTPSLTTGATLSGGTTCFGGLGLSGCTASGGTAVSLSSYSGGSAMGGGGGMGPGFGR